MNLPYTLGKFIRHPHLPCPWYTTLLAREVYYSVDKTSASPTYEIYQLRHGGIGMRHGRKYDWYATNSGPHPGTHFASVTMISQTCTNMHSSSPLPAIMVLPTSFFTVLESFENNSLWEIMTVDVDSKWIFTGIVGGTLAIAHDGSYMASKSAGICLAWVIMYCRGTKQWLGASVAEWSNDASNYQGELLGAAMAILLLRAASVTLVPPLPPTILHCNNCRVISHSNSPLMSLPKKQQQSNLIRLIKYLAGTNI
jgi:hypothetical protein